MIVRTGWQWWAENPHLNGHWLAADTLLALEDDLACTPHCEGLSEGEAQFPRLYQEQPLGSPESAFFSRKFSEACVRSVGSDAEGAQARWPTMHLLTLERPHPSARPRPPPAMLPGSICSSKRACPCIFISRKANTQRITSLQVANDKERWGELVRCDDRCDDGPDVSLRGHIWRLHFQMIHMPPPPHTPQRVTQGALTQNDGPPRSSPRHIATEKRSRLQKTYTHGEHTEKQLHLRSEKGYKEHSGLRTHHWERLAYRHTSHKSQIYLSPPSPGRRRITRFLR